MKRALIIILSLAGCADDGDLSETPPTETPGVEDSASVDSEAVDSSVADDTFTPDTFAPDTFVPDTIAPDTFVPDTFVPDTNAPDTIAPDTFVPDTIAPDTFVPDTFVPDTFVPDTAPVDTCMRNVCGGCATLTGMVGDACGTCGGRLACSGSDALVCTGSTPLNACGGCGTITSPAPGTACGICGTYVCNTAKTSTTCNETATTGSDLTYVGTGSSQSVYDNTLAFAYPVRHKGRLVSLTVRVSRQFIALGMSTPWSLTIEALRGTPASPGASLGSITVDATTITIPTYSTAGPPTATTTFSIPSSVTLNVGDPIFFRITRVSPNNAFHFFGSAGAGPADLVVSNRASSTAPWTTAMFDPEIDVKMNGCF